MKNQFVIRLGLVFLVGMSLTACQTVPCQRNQSSSNECDDSGCYNNNSQQVVAVGEAVSVFAGTAIPIIQAFADCRGYGGYGGARRGVYNGAYYGNGRGGPVYRKQQVPYQYHGNQGSGYRGGYARPSSVGSRGSYGYQGRYSRGGRGANGGSVIISNSSVGTIITGGGRGSGYKGNYGGGSGSGGRSGHTGNYGRGGGSGHSSGNHSNCE